MRKDVDSALRSLLQPFEQWNTADITDDNEQSSNTPSREREDVLAASLSGDARRAGVETKRLEPGEPCESVSR